MNARAGVVTSQVVWFVSLPVTTTAATFGETVRGALAGFVVAALASFLPDLEHAGSTAGRTVGKRLSAVIRFLTGGHRMGTHSLIAIAVMWLTTRYLLDSQILANAAAIGWSSHVFVDSLTKDGVAPWWPLSRSKTRYGWITTGSPTEDTYVMLVKWLVGAPFAVGYTVLAFPLVAAQVTAYSGRF